jgi:predicted ArsR family transcriptional regulator
MYRAMTNSLRRELLAYLLVNHEGSPKKLSEVLGANVNSVGDHMQSLLRGGLIHFSGTDSRRGGTIHVLRTNGSRLPIRGRYLR